jgi:putative colanic acid biosysnthesis UDP-glucose lipid carrier transferase
MVVSSNRSIHQHWSVRELVYRLVDAVCIIAGLTAAAWFTGFPLAERQLTAGLVAILVAGFIAEVCGAYRSWRGVSVDREMACILVAWTFGAGALLVVGLLTGELAHWPHWILCVWFTATPALIVASRLAIRSVQYALRARGYNTHWYALVGVNEQAFQLARNIETSPEMGLRLRGFYDDRPPNRLPAIPADLGRQVGNLDELVKAARSRKVDTIYITFPMRAEERIRRTLAKLGDTTASVYIVPDFFVFELLHSRWTSIGGMPVVSIYENPFYGIDGMVKRAMDVLVAGLLLAVLALPMAVIAVLVKSTSPGPVFFRQKRYGLDGREIWVWKFRTMRVCQSTGQFTPATRNDPRVTRLGAILRALSLDELPQLVNVLQGSMSLVGPRPHASLQNEEYRRLIRGYMLRHKVRPGITGLAQVSGWRGETDTLDKMEKRIACDHQYIRDWSLWLDLKILFKTIFVVFSRRNAY